MKPSSLQRVFILPFVFLLCCLILIIGCLLYRAAEEATLELSHNALIDVMARINKMVEQQLFGAHATLSIVAPEPLMASDGSQQPNIAFSAVDSVLKDRLWIATSLFPEETSYVYFAGANGSFSGVKQLSPIAFQVILRDARLGVNKIYDVSGPRAKRVLSLVQKYEPRTRTWYVNAVTRKHETWSPVFSDYRSHALALALSKPIYRDDGELLGVASSSLFLTRFSDFLHSLTIGERGVAFIMESDGTLIASSSKESIFWLEGEKLLRLKAADGASNIMRSISTDILQFFNHNGVDAHYSKTLDAADGHGNIAVAAQMQHDTAGLNWIVVAAVPSGDYYGTVTENVYQTLLLGLLAIGITFVLGFLILRRALGDLRKLTHAAKSIGNGEPFAPLDIRRSDEIGQLAHSFQEMERNLHTDHLTGVLNRESLIAQIEFRLRHVSQASPLGFTLMFIDLDKFKSINDQYGHEEGDRVLIEVAKQLRYAVRKEDAVSRFGGDEFMIYLHGVARVATAAAMGDKIRSALQKPMSGRDGVVYQIDASIGCAIYPDDGLDVETLLRVADQRMFENKRGNRGV